MSDESAQKALSTFSEAYWPPLYTFVRRRGYSPADAQDIVQGFFEHLFAQNALSRADQEKGRLRTFLLVVAAKLHEGSARPGPGAEARRRPTGDLAGSKNGGSRGGAFRRAFTWTMRASYDLTWASSIVKRAWEQMQKNLDRRGKGSVVARTASRLSMARARRRRTSRTSRPASGFRWQRCAPGFRGCVIVIAKSCAPKLPAPFPISASVDQELHYLHQLLPPESRSLGQQRMPDEKRDAEPP